MAQLRESAERVQDLALRLGVSVAAAESCTGGLIGHAITEIPGSSDYFLGGIVSYANSVKVQSLGVPEGAVERHGAVSAQVAKAMAVGVRERLDADYGVAVTGVAGPGGGSADKPVGLTYVALAGPDGDEVRRHTWDGGRSENKLRSALAALELLAASLGRVPRVGSAPEETGTDSAPDDPPLHDQGAEPATEPTSAGADH